jgi:hypothetical protein
LHFIAAAALDWDCLLLATSSSSSNRPILQANRLVKFGSARGRQFLLFRCRSIFGVGDGGRAGVGSLEVDGQTMFFRPPGQPAVRENIHAMRAAGRIKSTVFFMRYLL